MMRSARDLLIVGMGSATMALAAGGAYAQASGKSASSGIYTAAQAERGHAAYDAHCASCHGGSLSGGDVNPQLAGSTFQGHWTGQTVGALVTRVKTTMPLNDPGSLGAATSTDVVAYILKANGYPAGSAELPKEAQIQQMFKIDAPR